MPKTSYNYLRAVELEGRHPQDAGVWCTTLDRTHVGEGHVPHFAPHGIVEGSQQDVLPAVPKIVGGLRGYITYFRTLDSIEQVKTYIQENKQEIRKYEGGVQISLPIFKEWIDAPSGRIPMVDYANEDGVLSHSVVIKDYDDEKAELTFVNSWPNWGDDSYGYLPYDYFARYAFECKVFYVVTHYLHEKRQMINRLGVFRGWTARSTHHQRVYGFEFLGESGYLLDRVAWCFLTDHADYYLVEDFYVRPEFRGVGYGRELADRVRSFVESRGKRLILPVPFADCRSESPGTYDAMEAIVRRLGLVFFRSDSHFAAYLAHTPRPGESGSPSAIEPDFIPIRPKSSLAQAVAAFAVGMGNAPSVSQPPSTPPVVAVKSSETLAANQAFPEVGTEAWDAMNRRRHELIRKKVRQGLDGLTTAERKEYEWLQAMSLRLIQEKCERPTLLQRELEQLRSSLSQQ